MNWARAAAITTEGLGPAQRQTHFQATLAVAFLHARCPGAAWPRHGSQPIATLAQQIADHVLAWSFRAAGRRNGDKILRGRQLRIEAAVDRVEDSLPGIAGIHGIVSPVTVGLAHPAPPRSNHTLQGFAESRIAVRIASAPLHCRASRDRGHEVIQNVEQGGRQC